MRFWGYIIFSHSWLTKRGPWLDANVDKLMSTSNRNMWDVDINWCWCREHLMSTSHTFLWAVDIDFWNRHPVRVHFNCPNHVCEQIAWSSLLKRQKHFSSAISCWCSGKIIITFQSFYFHLGPLPASSEDGQAQEGKPPPAINDTMVVQQWRMTVDYFTDEHSVQLQTFIICMCLRTFRVCQSDVSYFNKGRSEFKNGYNT